MADHMDAHAIFVTGVTGNVGRHIATQSAENGVWGQVEHVIGRSGAERSYAVCR